MKVFNHYARYYDLLYQEKDYALEASFIHRQIREHGPRAESILELGSGTGRHAAELASLGYNVEGIERSSQMLDRAAERLQALPAEVRARLSFQESDARQVRTGKAYDVVLALFHVMSYQTANSDLSDVIATAAAHLKPGAMFLFDFWYGPAVLTDPPTARLKRLEDDDILVTRLAEPQTDYNRNLVTVEYQIIVKDKRNGQYHEVRESHPMRYLFLPELELLLASHRLQILKAGAWCSDAPIGKDSWYSYLASHRV